MEMQKRIWKSMKNYNEELQKNSTTTNQMRVIAVATLISI